MNWILYERDDGCVCYVRPVINSNERGILTAEQALQRAMKDVPVTASKVTVVDESYVKSLDQSKRALWRLQANGAVTTE